jgi:hypothetical protein
VKTKANCLPSGHSFHPFGFAPAVLSMGQTPAVRLMIPGIRKRFNAQRIVRGT